jgi:nicotinamide phosphoribosyltransferase
MPQALRLNPIFHGTDSYKLGHWWQYPPDAKHVYSYLESRGGFWKHTLFFGLQYILKSCFVGQVFNKADIDEARALSAAHFGTDEVFNYKGWTRLLEKHGGRLPLRIKALPEGTVVPTHNCLFTIMNTDEEFPWLTNWGETEILQSWYPITVATLSYEIRQAIGKDLVRTGNPDLLSFKLHDFGFRGVSSRETAAIGGGAHLVNFLGTDTTPGIAMLMQFYDNHYTDGRPDMPGFSIAAMEHSTVTSWGREHELEAYRNQIRKSPTPLTACVIDSYDTHNAVENIFGGDLREEILRRPGTVVLRPDSGDPCVVIEDIFNTVADKFGFETNSKGWKVLPQQIRVIQGDGVNYQNILRINSHLTRLGWSMDNWGYGMGGALLQQQNRDTMRFAIKCSAINRAGEWQPVYKKPATDITKASMAGRFAVVDHGLNGNHRFHTIEVDPKSNEDEVYGNCLRTVFENGELKKDYTLDEVRATAKQFDRFVEEAAGAAA